MSDVAANLARVKAGIAAAARAAGRAPDGIVLVAVAKGCDAGRVRPALEAGHRVFGENRVREARDKWPALKEAFPGVELQLIGPLQTNKVRDAVALFDVVCVVDRPRLVAALAREMERQDRRPVCFAQVNTGAEATKAGCPPDAADGLIAEARTSGLDMAGLMCVPPLREDPAPHFDLLAAIARRNGLERLSMGMSGDYAAAIAAGATHVRVGTAIFGPRTAT